MRDEQPFDEPLLTDFMTELRSWGTGGAPVPSEALATLLAADDHVHVNGPVPADPVPPARRKKMLLTKLAGLGVFAKAALGVGVAAAAVTTAGAGGVLPGPAQHGVAVAINAISPLDIPDGTADAAADEDGVDVDVTVPTTTIPGTGTDGTTDDDGDDADTDEAATDNHGACVSAAARDRSLTGREHGQAVSAIAQSDCGKEDKTTTSTTTPTTTTTIAGDDTEGATADSGPSANSGPGNSGDHSNAGGNGKGSGKSGSGK